jgi:hypothetical protein
MLKPFIGLVSIAGKGRTNENASWREHVRRCIKRVD